MVGGNTPFWRSHFSISLTPRMFSRFALSLVIALFLAVAAMAAPVEVDVQGIVADALAQADAVKNDALAQAGAAVDAAKTASEAAKKKCLESPNAPEGVSADCQDWIITDTTCVAYVLGPITPTTTTPVD